MSFREKIFSGISAGKNKPHITNENGTELGGSFHVPERRPDQEQKDQQFCAGYNTILAELKRDPEALQSQIERLKSLPDYNEILGKLIPYFKEEHWEMAAVLESYDKQTFDHSLRVAAFMYDITHEGGETEAYMRTKVGEEQSSLEELFTAALFHDIGKTAIPREILHDNHSRREWAKRANDWAAKKGIIQHFDPKMIETFGDIELDHYFMELRIDGVDPLNIVPLEEIFSIDILKKLKQHGINPLDTFRKVLECHEDSTGAILRYKKMYKAADIASRHHDYNHRPIRLERYPTEISAVRLGFILSLLRSLDVYDALTSNDRSYKEAYHPLVALEILIKETKAEFTEPELTEHIVRDLYKKLESSQENIPNNDKEKQALNAILEFIR